MLDLEQSAFCKIVTKDELECLQIEHPKFFAEITLQGAQLTQFKHNNLGDFVWLSPDAIYQQGSSLRGGIPICWPWFGVLEKNPAIITQVLPSGLGAHGFARNQNWRITDLNERVDGVTIALQLKDNEYTRSIWPFAFELTCRFHLGDDIRMELVNYNSGDKPFAVSQALHTYFPVKNIERLKIHGANQHRYIDALDQWQSKQQHGPIEIKKEVDRIYLGVIRYEWEDEHHQFTLTSNSESSVVWNPWIDKSLTLSQFPADGYQSMMCIENGNILDNVISLMPNEHHTLNMVLTKQ
ncbi:MAG: D-hexose-6-phosphate mutarotase [Gammaproteobacteria bacterium]|nr:D-hexose-6-phosphate mutarotase [Gammaproteobacteria bacterium]